MISSSHYDFTTKKGRSISKTFGKRVTAHVLAQNRYFVDPSSLRVIDPLEPYAGTFVIVNHKEHLDMIREFVRGASCSAKLTDQAADMWLKYRVF